MHRCDNACGKGFAYCDGVALTDCDAPTPTVQATVRDFSASHPDFQYPFVAGVEPGIVADSLDEYGKPVYTGGRGGTRTTTGPKNFAQWFRDSPGINRTSEIVLDLQVYDEYDPRRFLLLEEEFFPIDNTLLGNEGRRHNYHFTIEMENSFEYQGGEVFSFAGDDDVWVFINGRLAVDLGGTHNASVVGSVSLDEIAPEFGLVRGQVHPLKLFYAERHTSGAVLFIDSMFGALVCP